MNICVIVTNPYLHIIPLPGLSIYASALIGVLVWINIQMDISQISTRGLSYGRRTTNRHYIVEVIQRQKGPRPNNMHIQVCCPLGTLSPYERLPMWQSTSLMVHRLMDIVWYPGWFPPLALPVLALIVCHSLTQHKQIVICLVNYTCMLLISVCDYIHEESRMITKPAYIA